MPSNIEVKARVADPARKRELAAHLAQSGPTIWHQRDTFFSCEHGRLKLRELSASEGELIFYQRADGSATKQSDYSIYRTGAPAALLALLSAAMGTGPVVTKTRLLYLVGQTRIHLDSVESLGSFIELEVVLRPGQSPEEGHHMARELMKALEIAESDLVHCAYADLLASGQGA